MAERYRPVRRRIVTGGAPSFPILLVGRPLLRGHTRRGVGHLAPAIHLKPIRRAITAIVASIAVITSLSACHSTPVVSSSHRPDNIFDVALIEGAAGNDEEVAERLLAERYPLGGDTEALLSYLASIGSNCVSHGASRRVCRISSFLEATSALWLFDVQLTAGETLALWEYIYITTIESSDGKIKSIDVVRDTARLK